MALSSSLRLRIVVVEGPDSASMTLHTKRSPDRSAVRRSIQDCHHSIARHCPLELRKHRQHPERDPAQGVEVSSACWRT